LFGGWWTTLTCHEPLRRRLSGEGCAIVNLIISRAFVSQCLVLAALWHRLATVTPAQQDTPNQLLRRLARKRNRVTLAATKQPDGQITSDFSEIASKPRNQKE